MDLEKRQYELNYLLGGDLGEEKTETAAEDIRKEIEEKGGIVSDTDKPQKNAISYPIKKHETAYFGRFQFILAADNLKFLRESLTKLDILRFLIRQKRYSAEINKRTTKRKAVRQIKTMDKEILLTEAAAPREPLRVEEIDKKLEEIFKE